MPSSAAATPKGAQLLCACAIQHRLNPELLSQLRCDVVQRVAAAERVDHHPHGSCSDLLGWKVCHGCKQGERAARLACLDALAHSPQVHDQAVDADSSQRLPPFAE